MSGMDDSAAEALGRMFFEALRFGSALTAAGEALVAPVGLSPARWQVLATSAYLTGPCTVADLARRLALTRQSVQRVVNDLAAAGLVVLADNPDHARARLVAPTAQGRAVLARAEALRRPWTAALAEGLTTEEIGAAATLLRRLRQRLSHRG
jgi:DNA-binding MarR family transcriptional regulator